MAIIHVIKRLSDIIFTMPNVLLQRISIFIKNLHIPHPAFHQFRFHRFIN
jgi:hypothetical protein